MIQEKNTDEENKMIAYLKLILEFGTKTFEFLCISIFL